ncbi:hypothetical protein pb186bvf_017204 [Paramecium bursaria]
MQNYLFPNSSFLISIIIFSHDFKPIIFKSYTLIKGIIYKETLLNYNNSYSQQIKTNNVKIFL